MIEVYVLEGCPYCNNTLSLLNASGKKYKKTVVAQNKKAYYNNRHNMTTYPQILVKMKGNYITLGGNSELMKTMEIMDMLQHSKISNGALYLMLEEFRN